MWPLDVVVWKYVPKKSTQKAYVDPQIDYGRSQNIGKDFIRFPGMQLNGCISISSLGSYSCISGCEILLIWDDLVCVPSTPFLLAPFPLPLQIETLWPNHIRHAQNLHNCSICNLLLFCIILIVNMHFQSLFHASIGNSIQQPMQSTTTYLFSLSFPSSRILRWTSLASMSKRHTPPNPPRRRMKWSQTAKNIKAIELGMRLEKLFVPWFLFGTSLKLLPGRFRPSLFTQMHGNPSEKLFCSVSIKDLYTDFLAGWRQPAVCRKLVGVVLVWRFFCRWSINVSHKEMSLAQSLVLQ